MKFLIKGEEENEEEVKLYLEIEKEGEVDLKGVDNSGYHWHIMTFRNGRFYRGGNVNIEGLAVDMDGRIKEEV